MSSTQSGLVRAQAPSGFLRAEPSRFFGRVDELRRLDHDAVGGITAIVGPAGIGKTRLALRFGITRSARFASVWFCDVSDAACVSEMIAIVRRTLAASDRVDSPSDPIAVERAIAARAGALVIIDNLEHLLPDAAVTLARWVQAAPDVRFVVTSRERLGIGEDAIEVGPLPVPSPGTASGDAVDLFVERVRTHRGYWVPRSNELANVAQIVSSLGGVPLALELAAAHVEEGDPMDDLFSNVSRSSGTDAPRSIERAFSLLDAAERAALCQCAVFHGSFTLQAASRVVRLGINANTNELITRLARKSLLEVTRHDPLRFSMCEGIRSYSAKMLLRSSEANAVRWRHAEHYFERASAIAQLGAHAGASVPADAADDRDDLRAAMALAAEHGHPQVVLRIALALDAMSMGAGLAETELAHLDAALRAGAASDLDLVARALGVRAGAAFGLGRLDEARRDAEMALRLASELGNAAHVCAMSRAAGQSCFQLGELDAALAHLERSLGIASERGDTTSMASVQYLLGSLHQTRGDAVPAREAFESCLAIAQRTNDRLTEARAHMGLAWAPLDRGEHERARLHYERALDLALPLRARRIERIVTGYLGILHFDRAALTLAEDHLRRAVFECKRAGDVRVEGIFEGIRGGVLAALDRTHDAERSFALSDDLLGTNTYSRGVTDIHRGQLDLAFARTARASGDLAGVLQHLAAARKRASDARTSVDESAPLVERSDDARLAVRILERAIAAF